MSLIYESEYEEELEIEDAGIGEEAIYILDDGGNNVKLEILDDGEVAE